MAGARHRYHRIPQYAPGLNVVPLRKWEGGLEGVEGALKYMKESKVSAEKIVISIA